MTVGGALVAYALMVLAVAWAGWRGQRWANGAMVFIALLHLAVALSMARDQRGYLLLAVLAAVALVAAGRRHLDDLRQAD